MKRLLSLTFVICVSALSACQTLPMGKNASHEVMAEHVAVEVFLVRHAEKILEVRDPDLTKEGQARAVLLADMLSDANITHIHSSNYKRTRQTAAPLAKKLGLEVELYDPRDLPAVAQKIKTQSGRHLVVGHSNTTPQLTQLLGGNGEGPIVEATEYDRLYYVTIAKTGETASTLLRFGEP